MNIAAAIAKYKRPSGVAPTSNTLRNVRVVNQRQQFTLGCSIFPAPSQLLRQRIYKL